MSTEGLMGIEAIRKLAHDHLEDAKTKALALADEVNKIEQEKQDIEAQKQADAEALAALTRRFELEHDDNLQKKDEALKALDHRAGQRVYIVTGNRPDEPPAPPEPPVQQSPVVPPARNGETQELPRMPQPSASEDEPLIRMHYPDDPDEPPASRRRRNNGDVRVWRGIAWLMALFGALIGLIIAGATYQPMWSSVSGAWNTLLVTLWFVILILACGYTGGWLGARFEERRAANVPRQH